LGLEKWQAVLACHFFFDLNSGKEIQFLLPQKSAILLK